MPMCMCIYMCVYMHMYTQHYSISLLFGPCKRFSRQCLPAASARLPDLSKPIYAGISGKNSWGFMELA